MSPDQDPLRRPWSRGEKVIAAIVAAAVAITIYGAARYPYPARAPVVVRVDGAAPEAPASLLGRRYQ